MNPPDSCSNATREPRESSYMTDVDVEVETVKSMGSATGTTTSAGSESGTSFLRQRLTIFDRVPMIAYMLTLLAIPVVILVGYSAAIMDRENKALDFFSQERVVIEAAVGCAHELQAERGRSSGFLGTALNSSNLPAATSNLEAQRQKADVACDRLYYVALDSSLADGSLPVQVRDILAEVHVVRALIDTRNIGSIEMRRTYFENIEQIGYVLATLAKDPLMKSVNPELKQLLASRLRQNWIGQCRAATFFIVSLGHPAPVENIYEVHRCWTGAHAFDNLFKAITDSDGVTYTQVVEADPKNSDWANYTQIVMTGDYAQYSTIPPADLFAAFVYVLGTMSAADRQLIAILAEGSVYKRSVTSAALLMSLSIVACSVVTCFVIFMQRRFQARMDHNLKMSASLNRAVQRFVPKNQLKVMGVRSILEIASGDHVEVALTMLFSDIRDFTQLSERMSREELFRWLQSYFGRMTKVTEQHHGYVDKFIGDALFCVFSHPKNAVQCGVSMQATTEKLNVELNAEGKTDLVRIGVGIHHGVVVSGVFGDSDRLSCTLVSPDVNMASRLEGVTKSYGAKVIISEAVYERIDPDMFSCRCLGKLQVQGSSEVVVIYEVFQNDEPRLKVFKNSSKSVFESSAMMKDMTVDEAVVSLQGLSDYAGASQLVDHGVLAKLLSFNREGAGSECPDQFEKSGASAPVTPVGKNLHASRSFGSTGPGSLPMHPSLFLPGAVPLTGDSAAMRNGNVSSGDSSDSK